MEGIHLEPWKSETDRPLEKDHPWELPLGLVEEAFDRIAPSGLLLVQRFYQNLFQQFPRMKTLFPDGDQGEQEKKLWKSLSLIRRYLRDPDKLIPALQNMGQRHQAHGAQQEYYELLKGILLETFQEVGGQHWTQEDRRVWQDTLNEIVKTMLGGYGPKTHWETHMSRKNKKVVTACKSNYWKRVLMLWHLGEKN